MHAVSQNLWSFNTRDLMRASSCAHCTALSIARTLKVPSVMDRLEPAIKAEKEKPKSLAMKYGDIFEANLQAELIESMGSEFVRRPEKDGDFEQTITLMKDGAPVIYQGGLTNTVGSLQFSGKPDFLVRADYQLEFIENKLTAVKNPDGQGLAGYTVWDAKYSGKTKPAYLLQVAIYIDALDSLGLKAQGMKHGTVLGKRTIDSFEEIEIVPAMKLARAELLELVDAALIAQDSGNLINYEHDSLSWHCPAKDNCAICEYPDLCKEDRRITDDLVQVAGITQAQIAKLATVGVGTMRALATANATDAPNRMVEASFEKLNRQAKEQVKSLDSKKPEHELLVDPEIQFLPPRSKNDIFFDMEGFPYYIEGDGLEYLFGNTNWDDDFIEFWAHDRVQEKQAFIEFVDWAVKRMKEDPSAHIYHYASYENSALTRLSVRFGVMENEVRWLQVNGKLVDLYNYVRNSLVVGEESYSIKYLERHYDFKRTSDTKNANASIEDYETWRELVRSSNDETLPSEKREEDKVEAKKVYTNLRKYNIEDVQSTRELYMWLERQPGACSRFGEDRENPLAEELEGGILKDGQISKSQQELERLQAKTAELFAKVADWHFGEDAEADERAMVWLALTHSILFYKREEVMFWTDLFIRLQADDAALEDDRKGSALLNVSEISRSSRVNRAGATVEVITYSAEIPLEDLYEPEAGDDVVIRYEIGARRQKRDYGKIISWNNNTIVFTRDSLNGYGHVEPNAVLECKRYRTDSKQSTLESLATEITEAWGDPKNPAPTSRAILDLLLRRAPRLKNGASLPVADPNDYLPAVISAAEQLDGSTLCIQGPPGSGKTYLASRTVAHLVNRGFKVAVVANSHSAVENLLEACIESGMPAHQVLKAKQTGSDKVNPWTEFKDVKDLVKGRKLVEEPGYVVGGTSFTFCNPGLQAEDFDYLFIDEAAQFSLVDAMANSAIAHNLILLGDPQQLAQVVMAVHPGGVSNSALGHYMGEHSILPKHMGYFVEVTRRLHPEINKPVSWLSYEGKLRSHETTKTHFVEGLTPGITSIEVDHQYNVSRSDEEVAVVKDLVVDLAKKVPEKEILIVAAYNAQVDAIRDSIQAAGYNDVMVGTVDKFQGREGLIVIFSFAASSAADAPRGLEFLLERNRLNVAISRAKGHCYLVHSTGLLKSRFKNVEELKCVSRLAGILEFAH